MNNDRDDGESNNERRPPSIDRPTKRAKMTESETAVSMTVKQSQPTLPPDAWAAIMEYLSLSDAISLSSTCRTMYHDAAPLVTSIHVMDAIEMKSSVSKCFTDVRDIYIYSLHQVVLDHYTDDEEEIDFVRYHTIDFETSMRAAPFLSNNFVKLERVFFGSIHNIEGNEEGDSSVVALLPYVDTKVIVDDDGGDFDSVQENISRLIDSLSAAFRSGALSQNLLVRGLRCFSADEECRVCKRACKSFPIISVVNFECDGSSRHQLLSKRSFDLDVCLERDQLEHYLGLRPGGHDILHSKERVLNLLGQGICRSYDEISLRIVYYSESQLRELEAAIKYARLDTSTLELSELTEAIMKSFCINERHGPASKYTCLLSEKAREHFSVELGLQLDVESELFHFENIDFIQTIVSEIKSNHDKQLRDHYVSILLLTGTCDSSIQVLVESGIVATLIDFVEKKNYGVYIREKSVQILTTILVYNSLGSSVFSDDDIDQRPYSVSKLVLGTYGRGDLRVIPYLVQLIASNSNDDTRSIGVCFLSQIIQHENEELIASIVEADGVPNLVSCLRPETIHMSSTVSAISGIAKMSQDYCKLVLKSGVLEVMSSSVNQCWACIGFIHGLAMDSEKRSILLEFFHAESVSTLVQSMDLYPGSYGYAKIIDILSVVLSKPMINNIDADILSEAIPNLIEQLRVDIKIGRRVTKIVIVMTAIAKASNDCRDRVLQTDVTNRLRGGLDDDDSIFSGHCLILLSLERRHERIMSSVDRIRTEYIRPLVNLMASDDQSELGGDIRTAAYHFFALLLKERMSNTTANAMVQANIIPTSINILKQKGKSDLDICVLHLSALSCIAELSSSHRAKMIDAGIMDLLPSGIKANSVELRSKWITLVNTLITKDSDIIPTLIDYGVIPSLSKSMKVKDTLFLQVLSTLKDAANKSTDCLVLLLEAGVLKMTSSALTQSNKSYQEWLSFLYVLMRKCKHDVVQKFVDSNGIVHLVKAAKKWGVDSHSSFIISTVILTKQECVHEAANAGGLSILVETIMNQKHEYSSRVNSLMALSKIVETSDKYRDTVLQTGLMNHAVLELKCQFSTSQCYYLCFLYTMIHPGHYKPSIENIIDLKLISKLVCWVGLDDFDDFKRTDDMYALQILTDILYETKYKKSIVKTMIDSDVARSVTTFIEKQLANDCDLGVALNLLAKLTKSHSSLCRDKVLHSGIVNLLSSGIMSSSIKMRSHWVDLIYNLIDMGPGSYDAIKTLVDSRVIDTLVDATEKESDNNIKSRACSILRSVYKQYSENKTSYIVLLHKRKSWLMVKTCREEVNESLKAALSEMKKMGNADYDINEQLSQIESRISNAQQSLDTLSLYAGKIVPYNEWRKKLDRCDLPNSLLDIDKEIKRTTLLIESCRSADGVRKSSRLAKKPVDNDS